MPLLSSLSDFIEKLDPQEIPVERRTILQKLITYIQSKVSDNQAVNLNFICTHNSRRSQLSQIWAQVAAYHYGINLNSFSGGVEVTAFNERAMNAIKEVGFSVERSGEQNPHYFVSFATDARPIKAFSKVYDDKSNMSTNFAAVMTCAHADENCPFIPGAEARIPVRYEDPKTFDGTSLEQEKYAERSKQIANEMFYVFSEIRK